MPKFFTLLQAEALLPEVNSALQEAIRSKAAYEEAEAELQEYTQRITAMGGTMVDRDRFRGVKERRQDSGLRLKAAVERVQELGCLIKDLDIGLLDFPTLYRGEEVYLCWRLGEEGIQFWHRITEGFRGRKKIDREFLDHHQGDTPS